MEGSFGPSQQEEQPHPEPPQYQPPPQPVDLNALFAELVSSNRRLAEQSAANQANANQLLQQMNADRAQADQRFLALQQQFAGLSVTAQSGLRPTTTSALVRVFVGEMNTLVAANRAPTPVEIAEWTGIADRLDSGQAVDEAYEHRKEQFTPEDRFNAKLDNTLTRLATTLGGSKPKVKTAISGSTSSSVTCTRCFRVGHVADGCYAKTDINKKKL
jgi:hypothetical protein